MAYHKGQFLGHDDILDNIDSDGLLFADDTKILRSIRNKHDAVALQSDINALKEWSNKWLLRFNPKKCHVLSRDREYYVHNEISSIR